MKEFKCSSGHTFIVGRRGTFGGSGPSWQIPNTLGDDEFVSWNDPKTGSWHPATDNEAGAMMLPAGSIGPDPSIHEEKGSVIFAGRVRFDPVGHPFIWGVTILPEPVHVRAWGPSDIVCEPDPMVGRGHS